MTSEASSERALLLRPCSLGLLAPVKAKGLVGRTIKQSYREDEMEKNQLASINMITAIVGSSMELDPLIPGQASYDCSPAKT